MTLELKRFERSHRSFVKSFRNTNPKLETYLRRFALRHDEKDHLSTTWLALMVDEDGQRRVAGYYTLALVAVERVLTHAVPSLEKLPSYPIPGVLLAQLAVDIRAQGQGVGRFLFEEAIGQALNLRDGISFRLFVTDAIDYQAVSFYEHFGMVKVSDTYPVRMILDLKELE